MPELILMIAFSFVQSTSLGEATSLPLLAFTQAISVTSPHPTQLSSYLFGQVLRALPSNSVHIIKASLEWGPILVTQLFI